MTVMVSVGKMLIAGAEETHQAENIAIVNSISNYRAKGKGKQTNK